MFIYDLANGSGVELNLLEFKGTRDYEGILGDLSNETNPNITLGEVRKGLVRQIKAGLLRYTVADKINDTIDYDEAVEIQDIDFGDPWNNWIFEIYGEIQLERKRVEMSLNTNLVLKAIVLSKNGEYEQMGNRMSPELNLNAVTKLLLVSVYAIRWKAVWCEVFPITSRPVFLPVPVTIPLPISIFLPR